MLQTKNLLEIINYDIVSTNMNCYILSDDNICSKDWYYDVIAKKVLQCKFATKSHYVFKNENSPKFIKENYFKIIASTENLDVYVYGIKRALFSQLKHLNMVALKVEPVSTADFMEIKYVPKIESGCVIINQLLINKFIYHERSIYFNSNNFSF